MREGRKGINIGREEGTGREGERRRVGGRGKEGEGRKQRGIELEG